MQINVSIDIKQVENMLGDIAKDVLPQAAARALNKTLQSVQSRAVKAIAQNMNLKQKDVRPAFLLKRATPQNLIAALEATGKRFAIIKLDPGATQDASGVNYIGQNGQHRHIPHAFIATLKSGHKGVFKRTTTKRLPIKELQGVSVPKVFLNRAIEALIQTMIDERWPVLFSHEVDFELERKGFS